MSVKFNPFTGNLDFTGTSGGGGGGSPTIGGSVIGGVPYSILTVDSSGNLYQLGPLTSGQLLIGNTANNAQAATLTGTSNQVIVTNGAGAITLSLPQSIGTSSTPSFNSLTINSGVLTKSQGGATSVEESYISPVTLTANTSTIGVSYAAATSDGAIISYTMKQNSSGYVRTGLIYIANNTLTSTISDNFTETNNVEISPSVSISGGNVQVSFLNVNVTNNTVFKAEIKKFKI